MIETNIKLTSFKQFSDHYFPIIEEALSNCLEHSFQDNRQHLNDALKHSLLNGGKRIRPLLCLISQRFFSSDIDKIIPFAVATEIIHTYSLIHDDLPCMDDDDLRRGKPTCHLKFGEDIAILAGDTLNTLAFEIISTQLRFDSSLILALLAYFSKSLGSNGLVGGQVLDIMSSSQTQDLNFLKHIHNMKTGALFKSCLVGPAILHQLSDDKLIILEQCAEHLGLLFQITDDILDVTGDSISLGKSPNKDVKNNTLTYVSLLGLDQAKNEAVKESKSAIEKIQSLNLNNTNVIIDLVNYMLKRTS